MFLELAGAKILIAFRLSHLSSLIVVVLQVNLNHVYVMLVQKSYFLDLSLFTSTVILNFQEVYGN